MVLVLFHFLISFNNNLFGQWAQTSGPGGGDVNCIVVTDSIIFAGTPYGGIYRSSNNGNSWVKSSNGLTDMSVYSLVAKGNYIFAYTLKDGIFRSTNDGLNWTQINNGLTGLYNPIICGNNIFVGSPSGLCVSAIDQISWTLVNKGPDDNGIYSLATNGSDLFANTNNTSVYNHGSWIFRSTNNGTDWTLCDLNLGDQYFVKFAASGNNILVATDTAIYVSTNNGTNWTLENIGLIIPYIDAIVINDSKFYAYIRNQGLYLSTDLGTSWTKISAGLNPYSTVYSLVFNGNNIFAGTFLTGMFVSTNDGINWNQINYGLANLSVGAIDVIGDTIYCYSGLTGNFLSFNKGVNWTPVVNSPGTLYMQRFGNYIYKSVGYDGIFLSTDNGANWTPINNGLPVGKFYTPALAVNGNNILASIEGYGVYLSTNNGSNWNPIGYFYNTIYALAASENKIVAATFDSVYYSTNNGNTWLHSNLNNVRVTAFLFNGSNILAGTEFYGVFLSIDNGASWTKVNDGLTNLWVTSLIISGTDLYAGTNWGGVWRRPLSQLTGISNKVKYLPLEYGLYQNYPNPFNPTTTINYTLQKAGNIKLTIYNAIGSKVATIVDEYKPAGNYSVQFNAKNLASGIYLYRLESGNFSVAKKFILLK
jgi:photosystem II stability/assembly factor-like uncharacterized protein